MKQDAGIISQGNLENVFCGNGIGGEFQVLFLCENESIVILRNKNKPNFYRIHPSYIKLVGLLSIVQKRLYKKVSLYIRKYAAFFLEFVHYVHKEYLS